MKVLIIVVGVVMALGVLVWLGLKIKPAPVERFYGKPFSTVGAAIWMDDGKPWAVFTVEDVVYNVDVGEYIRARGQ